jgi:hypothetical protein
MNSSSLVPPDEEHRSTKHSENKRNRTGSRQKGGLEFPNTPDQSKVNND